MIPLKEEPKEYFENFRVYEFCFFGCGNRTKFWHEPTNTPVCPDCGKKHKVAELKKDLKKPQKPLSFNEQDMIDFAWFMYKKIGKYSDDEQAHKQGKYLQLWKEHQAEVKNQPSIKI